MYLNPQISFEVLFYKVTDFEKFSKPSFYSKFWTFGFNFSQKIVEMLIYCFLKLTN